MSAQSSNAASTVTRAENHRVGISLITSADTEAAVEHVRDTQPDAVVSFRDAFYKIERAGQLSFDMAELSEIAGREIDTDIFLVNMSTYYGRIDVGDGRVDIYADIQPDRFKN